METVPKYWQHKTIPSSQWRTDLNKCKRVADRYLGQNSSYHADQNLSGLEESMRLYKVKDRQNELVSDCMIKAGYTPVR